MAVLQIQSDTSLQMDANGWPLLDAPDMGVLVTQDSQLSIQLNNGLIETFLGSQLTHVTGIVHDYRIDAAGDATALLTITGLDLLKTDLDLWPDAVRAALTGADTVFGGDLSDQLWVYEGDDVLYAGNGADFLYGNTGADTLFGNTGRDIIFGGQDRDLVIGGQDGDVLYGNTDDDRIYGNTGDDYLFGGAGSDTMFGGADADVLFGGQGEDILYGGAGNDWLSAGTGNDILSGGAGHDTFDASNIDGDVIDIDIITDATADDTLLIPQTAQITAYDGGVLVADTGGRVYLMGVDVTLVHAIAILTI